MQTHNQLFLWDKRVNIQGLGLAYTHFLSQQRHTENWNQWNSYSLQHIVPSFNQHAINPRDLLYCVCSGHYYSILTSSADLWLNSKWVYTSILISEPEVNRQVKSQRQPREFCVWAHLGGTCPHNRYRKKGFTQKKTVWFGLLWIKRGQMGYYEWREFKWWDTGIKCVLSSEPVQLYSNTWCEQLTGLYSGREVCG